MLGLWGASCLRLWRGGWAINVWRVGVVGEVMCMCVCVRCPLPTVPLTILLTPLAPHLAPPSTALFPSPAHSSFFHPDKDSTLRLVDSFLNKTGKFAIPGYPQKLGFLLYGPPGTGEPYAHAAGSEGRAALLVCFLERMFPLLSVGTCILYGLGLAN